MYKYPSENDLANAFIEWLEPQGYEIFKEVSCDTGRADIVARDASGKIHIFETKLSFNLSLIEQMVLHSYDPDVTQDKWAAHWNIKKYCAHYIWAVTPLTHIRGWKYNQKREIASYLCTKLGVGLIIATTKNHFNEAVKALLREPDDLLELYQGHKIMGDPGSNRGKYWTDFKQLNLELLQYVQDHPGCTLKEAACIYLKFRAYTKHPGNCIHQNINLKYLIGMRVEKIKNRIRIFITDEGLHFIKMYSKI